MLGLFGAFYVLFPYARPIIIFAAFGLLAWLLSQGMAFFCWRTSFNGLQFGFSPSAKGLSRPLCFVGVFYALAAFPYR